MAVLQYAMRAIDSYLHDDAVVPVFPLPDFLLFPGVVAPLHVFEPRYRSLLESVLDRQGTFAMATLKAGGRGPHLGSPDIWNMGCGCRVLDYEKLSDGRYYIAIEGLVKVRLHEVASTELYRLARVNVVRPLREPAVEPAREQRLRTLMQKIMTAAPAVAMQAVAKVEQLDFDLLLNVMAFHCPIPVDEKLKLFYAPSRAKLCDLLIKLYEAVEF